MSTNQILDSLLILWEHFKSFYIATSKASALFLSKSLQTENTEWGTLLTDIIAVSAALGALALPLSLSVIEATRSRYKSPTLLSIYTEVSKTNPQKINRLLFGTLTFTLFLKLTLLSNAVDFKYIIPLIFALVIFFTTTVSELYKHLSFTYKLMSNVNSIRDDLLNRIEKCLPNNSTTPKTSIKSKITRKKRKLKKYNSQTVIALIELETYDICSTPSKRDLDPKLIEILFRQLKNLPAPRSEEFMQDILGALPRMMAEVETSRELDIYQRVSGLYLYILPKAVIASNSFAHHLDEAIRISRFREHSLPPHGQFCRNGRIFMNCILEKPSRETYTLLFEHFKRLIWNALHTNPENIPEILNNADNLLFGTGYDDDPSYALHYNIEGLWGDKQGREIAKTIKECLNNKLSTNDLEQKLSNHFKPKIIEITKNNTPSTDTKPLEEKIDKIISEIITSITSREISAAIEIETLQTLGLLLEKNPDLIIKCRERKNPAGATAINIGRPLVPSSINACINALVHEKNFVQNFSIEEPLEFKIVDAISVLITYELWKDFVFNTNTKETNDYLNTLTIPNCTIRELKSAYSRIEVLEKSFKKTLSNRIIAEKLGLLDAQKEFLSTLASELCEKLKEKISDATRSKIRDQPLDNETLDRFRAELVEDWNESPALLLLKQIRLTKCRPYTFIMSRPRESFLADTGTHHSFNGIGQNLLNRYIGGLGFNILKRKGIAPSAASPSPFGTAIILTRKAFIELTDNGYTHKDGNLVWPNQTYQIPSYVIQSQESLYYQIYKNQYIIDLDYSENTDGYPITIGHTDNGEEIETTIRFNFSLSEIS